jgi:hypothetical protein
MKGHEILVEHKVLEQGLKKGKGETSGDREVRAIKRKNK